MFLWTEFLSASMYFSEFLKCISLSFWNVFLSASQLYFFRYVLFLSTVFLIQTVFILLSQKHFSASYQLYCPLTFLTAFLSVNQLYLLGFLEWMMAASRQIILVLRCWSTLQFFSLLVSWLHFFQFFYCISFSFSNVFLSVSQLYFFQFLNCISFSFSKPYFLVIESGWRQTMRRISGLQRWQEPPPIDHRNNRCTTG